MNISPRRNNALQNWMKGSIKHHQKVLQPACAQPFDKALPAMRCVVPSGVQSTLASTLQLSSWDHFRTDFLRAKVHSQWFSKSFNNGVLVAAVAQCCDDLATRNAFGINLLPKSKCVIKHVFTWIWGMFLFGFFLSIQYRTNFRSYPTTDDDF